jgi:cellulose synthase/poly-beta-1,6-N-acetylglucosamine synthase-like glycosyltransferase/peptidoglycan/xylan/chitin deacetylase (PgdA/CDA1 family)
LRDALPQIDLLFPEWLHVLKSDGRIQAIFDDDSSGRLRVGNDKVMPLLAEKHATTQVMPEVNNFDEVHQRWVTEVGGFFSSAGARASFRQQINTFLSSGDYKGLMIDFENIHSSALNGYRELIKEVGQDLHARGLKLYVAAPAADPDYPFQDVAANSDGIVLMNYDQHSPESEPGPLAAQNWFVPNLQKVLKLVPRDKLICGIANYGYDWEFQQQVKDGVTTVNRAGVFTISAQEAWEGAKHSGAAVDFDGQSLNPHVAFVDDESKEQHYMWFTDAATAFNQMRAAQSLGVDNFALWRLGSEDRALWKIWDYPQRADATDKLRSVPPGHDIDYEGPGEVVSITGTPSSGTRTLSLDAASGWINGEQFQQLPRPYEASQYGASYDQEVALTFDDGPDPRWTPEILDVLKAEHVPAAFFVLGSEASQHPLLLQRIYREGHEIGNHTWSHPDISRLSPRQLRTELNMTERLLAAQLGVKPLLFRPPYSIYVEPEDDDEARPIEIAQGMGYLTVGSRIDPQDWAFAPKRSAKQIVDGVFAEIEKGNIILLHDGGGDRQETVRALPLIIRELRSRGYSFVPVSHLLGKSRVEVMPSVSQPERWATRFDHLGFGTYAVLCWTLGLIFLLGDALIITRLLTLSSLAIFHRFRRSRENPCVGFQPPVAVLVPAFNEEKVIVRTVRSVLNSEYPNLRVIVIDDGSTDDTLERARDAFALEPRVTVLTKPNGGKAEALNYGLEHVSEEIFLGIDADTCIDPEAVALLVPHFQDQDIAAVAGNTRVGNQVNLWTRWQAVEYITSQNLERRALDVFGLVTVVPGAIGAWRTALVRQAGCYHPETVAEDADLTMALLERGYRVHYEDRALAYTEAPSTVRTLMLQRFRWSFGILQSVWKHRSAFMRRGLLGWVALPNIVIFQFALPIVAPFMDLIFLAGVVDYYVNQHSDVHPAGHSSALLKLVIGFAIFLLVDLIASLLAIALERGDGRWKNVRVLGYLWLQRFTYRPLFSLVIFKTFKRVLQGHAFQWGKLERTAVALYPLEQKPIEVPYYAESDTSRAA